MEASCSSHFTKPELIVFGGSFDPPHQGHLECVRVLKDHFKNAQILILPAPIPPIAGGGVKNTHASFTDRMHMCKLAFEGFGNIVVTDLEARLDPPYFTYSTLEAIKASFPNKKLGLFMGLDQFAVFENWQKPEQILRTANLIVAFRDVASASSLMGQVLTSLCQKLNVEIKTEFLHCTKLSFHDGSVSEIYFINDLRHPASSSAIRNMLNRNYEVLQWLPSRIVEYITACQLYGDKERNRGN